MRCEISEHGLRERRSVHYGVGCLRIALAVPHPVCADADDLPFSNQRNCDPLGACLLHCLAGGATKCRRSFSVIVAHAHTLTRRKTSATASLSEFQLSAITMWHISWPQLGRLLNGGSWLAKSQSRRSAFRYASQPHLSKNRSDDLRYWPDATALYGMRASSQQRYPQIYNHLLGHDPGFSCRAIRLSFTRLR